jgi:hypothetical protein
VYLFWQFWHLKYEAASMLVTDVGVHVRKANRASSLSLDKMNGSFTIQKAYKSSSFRGDRIQCNVLGISSILSDLCWTDYRGILFDGENISFDTNLVIYVCVCVCVCVYIYMYIYTHIYIYIHTYIYICVCVCVCVCGTNIPPIMIINRIYETQNLLFL